MAAAPATIEQPLSITVQGSTSYQDGTDQAGRLHVAELTSPSISDNRQYVAIIASSLNTPPIAAHEELAIEGLLSTLSAVGSQHLSELMRQGFREANRAIRGAIESGGPAEFEGVAMLALLTRGKYVTLGLVGPDRAYLMRANMLTQLTRDQRVFKARSRRKQDIEAQSEQSGSAPVQLLGEQDRLDSRSPAIFEITLLPEDRLGLLSRGVLELFPEDRILAALESGANRGGDMLTSGPVRTDGVPVLAAVLQVAPSREAKVYLPATAGHARPWWPMLFLLVALAAIATGVYFFAL